MTLFEASGGADRLRAMAERFFAKARADDVLGDMFSRVDPGHAKYLAGWLSVSFGGPQDYLDERGDLRFVMWQHAALRITPVQRARWAELMLACAVDVEMPELFRRGFARYVDAITRQVEATSNLPEEELRVMLALAPGETPTAANTAR